MSLRFALAGNPNSGKTTLFNEVTGSNQYVGNWPGVTVEKKEGRIRNSREDIRLVDLPGIYSLSPYSMEEIVSRDFIINEKPDLVINIVDATNIERNLYLATQLIELDIPVIIALNMMDAADARGDKIDIERLSKELMVPVMPIAASKGRGVRELVDAAVDIARKPLCKNKIMIYDDAIAKYIDEIKAGIISAGTAEDNKENLDWTAVKLLEGDARVTGKHKLPSELAEQVNRYRKDLEELYDNDIESIIADNRYRYITAVAGKAVVRKHAGNVMTISDKIDRVVTNRILAIPLFLAVMFIIFKITFGTVGTFTSDWLDKFINGTFAGMVKGWLESGGAADWLVKLVVNGIIGGVGSIIVFIPQFILLFLLLSLLEDSGYMARAAFVMDRLLSKIGLNGKSFIPMIIGFGCSVPAIMSTRTLNNEKDRRLTIILTPFMSCGARLPVYLMFSAAFFSKNQDIVIFSIYLLGVFIAVLSGILLKKTVFRGESSPFVMELPPYRVPALKSLIIHVWDRTSGFLRKAGTVIFAAATMVWVLQSFDFSLRMVSDPGMSILGNIGRLIAPVFTPLGFGDWKSAVSLITGFIAKESVVSTMGILHGVGEAAGNTAAMSSVLRGVFTPLTAYSFMAFTLLYMPCMAAFATIKREMASWKWTLFTVGYQTGTAWLVAFIIYQIGRIVL